MLFIAALFTVLLISTPQNPQIPADARQAIAAANADWIRAMKAQDAAAIAAPYAEDGIFVTATGTIVKGRDGVAQLMRERFQQIGTVVNGQILQDGLTGQGTLIYEWGHADLELARAGAPSQHSRGRYLTVWQKHAGGRWAISRNLSLPE